MKLLGKIFLLALIAISASNIAKCSIIGLDGLLLAAPSIITLVTALAFSKNNFSTQDVNKSFFLLCIFLFIAHPILNQQHSSETLFFKASNESLNYAQSELGSFVYANRRCPKDLSELPQLRQSYAIDPMDPSAKLLRVIERNGQCGVYSFGPDRFDNHAEIEILAPKDSTNLVASSLAPASFHLWFCRAITRCKPTPGDMVRFVGNLDN